MPISVGVIFEVRQAATRPGEVIHVAGNKPQLGDWMPLPQDDEKATRSLTTNIFMYPRWFMHMPIWFEVETQPEVEPAAGPTLDLQYKFVRDRRSLDDGFQVLKWEVSIQNRHLSLPAEDGSIWIISHAMWNNSSDKPQVSRIAAEELAPRRDALGGFGMRCVPRGYPSGRLPTTLVPRIKMSSYIGTGTDRDSFGESAEPSGRCVGYAQQRRGSEEFLLTPHIMPSPKHERVEGLSGTASWSIEAEFSANFSMPPPTPDRFFEDSLMDGLSDDSSEVDEENEQVGGVQHLAVADKAAPVVRLLACSSEQDTALLGGMSPVDRSRSHMQMREKLEQRRLLIEPKDADNDDTPEETAGGNQSLEDSRQALVDTTRMFEMCSDDVGRGGEASESSAGGAAHSAKTGELVYEMPLIGTDAQEAEHLRNELQCANKKASAEIIQLCSDLGREREHVKVLTAQSPKKDDEIADLLRENERLRSVASEASKQVETLFLQNAALRGTLEKAKISVMEGEMPIFQAKPPLVQKPSRNWAGTDSLRCRPGATDCKDMSEPSSPTSPMSRAFPKETRELREPQEEPEGQFLPCH